MSRFRFLESIYKKASASGSQDALQGLCPWTPGETSVPQSPGIARRHWGEISPKKSKIDRTPKTESNLDSHTVPSIAVLFVHSRWKVRGSSRIFPSTYRQSGQNLETEFVHSCILWYTVLLQNILCVLFLCAVLFSTRQHICYSALCICYRQIVKSGITRNV